MGANTRYDANVFVAQLNIVVNGDKEACPSMCVDNLE
jgi:ribosomal protein S4